MRITNPLIKHGLSEVIGAVHKEANQKARTKLVAALEAHGKPIMTKRRVLEIIEGAFEPDKLKSGR
jgi:hypothetical protein